WSHLALEGDERVIQSLTQIRENDGDVVLKEKARIALHNLNLKRKQVTHEPLSACSCKSRLHEIGCWLRAPNII
ncbi:MAG: hypothetical protein U1D69_03970, partial [Polynucleobacter sp.]|nr:hypothetical protein [Polynucleobacter sp.]